MHTEALAFVAEQLRDIRGVVHSVLEIGSRNVNGSPRVLFGPEVEYIGVDHTPGLDVDTFGVTAGRVEGDDGLRDTG